MRAYFFCNFYLSSIQNGIQSAHCLHELFTKYGAPHPGVTPSRHCQSTVLYEWATHHKTIIVLNGGHSQALSELYDELLPLAKSQYFPIATFSEDQASLNNALTCVGVVLPAVVYDREVSLVDDNRLALDPLDHLKSIISRYSLAR